MRGPAIGRRQAYDILQGRKPRLLAMIHAAQAKVQERFDVGRARTAVALIDALIQGAGTTYRSESVRQILADRNSLAQMNRLLALAGIAVLP